MLRYSILPKERWKHSTFPAATEWVGLDIVKAVGVVVILFVHSHFLLITDSYAIYAPNSTLVKMTRELMFLGSFIMLLPIMAGCALRLSVSRYLRGDGAIDALPFIRATFWTAVIMSCAGFMMNAMTWGTWYTFSWNMLQMVSLAYVIVAVVLLRFGLPGVMVVAAVFLFAAQPMESMLAPYRDNYFVGMWVGNNSRFIFWPLFPWVALPAMGFLIAHGFLRYRHQAKVLWGVFFIGVALVVISIGRGDFSAELNNRYVWNQLMHQPAIGEVLGGIGLFCVLICLAEMLSNRMQLTRYGVINSYSKGILWIYIMQMVVSYQLAPIVIDAFGFRNRLEMTSTTDILAYSFLPLLMMLLGWITGVGTIKGMQENRFRITLRKVR